MNGLSVDSSDTGSAPCKIIYVSALISTLMASLGEAFQQTELFSSH